MLFRSIHLFPLLFFCLSMCGSLPASQLPLLLVIKPLWRLVITHITGIWRSIVLPQFCFTFEDQTAPCTMNWQGVTPVKMFPYKNVNISRHHCGSISLLYSVYRFPTWPSATPTFPMSSRVPFEIWTSESQRQVVMRTR